MLEFSSDSKLHRLEPVQKTFSSRILSKILPKKQEKSESMILFEKGPGFFSRLFSCIKKPSDKRPSLAENRPETQVLNEA